MESLKTFRSGVGHILKNYEICNCENAWNIFENWHKMFQSVIKLNIIDIWGNVYISKHLN